MKRAMRCLVVLALFALAASGGEIKFKVTTEGVDRPPFEITAKKAGS